MQAPIVAAALFPIILAMAGADSIVSRSVLIGAWIVFAADYIVHRRLDPAYARSGRGLFDLVVAVATAPWFLIPGFGGHRFVAAVRLLRVVRALRATRPLRRLSQELGRIGGVAVLVMLSCAYVVHSTERSVNEGLDTFWEATWWATVTITTVGYGDIVPVTTFGRISAVVLMVAGLGVLGVLAGALAAFFGLDREPSAENTARPVASSHGTSGGLEDLRAQLAELEQTLRTLRERLE